MTMLHSAIKREGERFPLALVPQQRGVFFVPVLGGFEDTLTSGEPCTAYDNMVGIRHEWFAGPKDTIALVHGTVREPASWSDFDAKIISVDEVIETWSGDDMGCEGDDDDPYDEYDWLDFYDDDDGVAFYGDGPDAPRSFPRRLYEAVTEGIVVGWRVFRLHL